MALALLLALQPAAQPPEPVHFDLSRMAPIDFDLRTLRGSRCEPGEDGTIVVCGRWPVTEGYPLGRMAREFATRPRLADVGLVGNVRARAYLERGPDTNRVMLGIRLPF